MNKSLLGFILLTSPIIASAAGFGLVEQSGSGMGNAFAGGAAIAEDASTVYSNPAGMVYIQGSQLVGAVHLINPNISFNNEGSVSGQFRPLGNEGGNAGDLAFIPNFYYKTDLTDSVKFGIGVNTPFGLSTEYDKDWLGRFQAIKTELKTININPAIALKVNEQLSIGVGLSAMYAKAELTSAVNLGASERSSTVKGDDWGFGYNIGGIYQVTPDTRIGLAYRSKVEQHLDGDVRFSIATGPTPNGDVEANITLPEAFSLSAFSRLNNTWDLMGDVTWTRWSQFQELAIYRSNGALLSKTNESWENSLRYSIGANYNYSEALKLRAGIAYDQEAIKDGFRTARIPGNNRKWLSVGAGWKATAATKFDIGYAHLFISDTGIDDNQATATPLGKGRVRGEYEGSVDILSLQVSYNF